MMRADHALLGYVDCRVEHDRTAALLNLCRRYDIPYLPLNVGESTEQDAPLLFRCRTGQAKRLLAACEAEGIALTVVRRGGVPALVHRYRLRLGMAVGALLGAVLVTVATNVVWDVRIDGADALHLPTLREQLVSCGLHVGAWMPSLDTDAVESRLLLCSEEVAWVSINLRGTVARVQVRPMARPQGAIHAAPSNLVAQSDGVIDSVKLISGQVIVEPGELVRRGQLLVSGVRDSEAQGYGIGAAQGEVLARVEQVLTVQIDRVEQQKSYIGQKNTQKTLFFFGKSIKVFKNAITTEQNCDIIRKIETLCLPGGRALPISVETLAARLYEWREVTLDDETLTLRAYEQLGRELAAATDGAMLLSKRVASELTDTGVLLTCHYECIKNIAVSQPLEATAEEASRTP